MGRCPDPAAERLQAKETSPFAFLTASDGEIDARYVGVRVLKKPFGLSELEACLDELY
jgi:DNA-binding response OmpR family regulator